MPETPQANLPEKTTYYKDDQQVSMTPDEAIKFQGGSSDNPFGGLERSGWSTKAPTPTAPITPVVETKTETPKTPEQLDKETKDTEMKSASDNVKQEMTDQIAYLTSNLEKQAKEFENYTADIARIDAENDPMIQNIKDIFARRIATMESINKAMQGQVALAGSRSGLKRYASQMHQGLVSAETTAGMNRISELESQKLTAIQEAKRALKSDAEDKWKMFNQYMNSATEAYNNKVQAVKDLHTFLKDEEDRAYNQKIADINLQQVIREGQQATAESIAGAIYSALGEDATENMQYLTDKAEEYGVPVDTLISTVQAYAQEDTENQLALSKTLLDLGAKIPEGETQEVAPGVFVTGTKQKDQMWVESIIGNTKYKDLYVKEDGEYVQKQRISLGNAYKPGTTPDPDRKTDWDFAKETIRLNPDATDEEIALSLRENTKLSDGDINALIENRQNLTSTENNFDYEAVAEELYQNYSKSDALDEIDSYDISEDDRETLRELYMSKRAWYRNDPN